MAAPDPKRSFPVGTCQVALASQMEAIGPDVTLK
jgi:hypothetical protein